MVCLESATVKARKRHVCTWCREGIDAGVEYHRSKWVDGGDLWTQKAHTGCLDLVTRYGHYYALDEWDCIDWGEVLAWAAEDDLA